MCASTSTSPATGPSVGRRWPSFTRALAEKVLETGRPQALEPMSASDRKVVHDTAAEIDGIATESEGEDPRRRVVLRPA